MMLSVVVTVVNNPVLAVLIPISREFNDTEQSKPFRVIPAMVDEAQTESRWS